MRGRIKDAFRSRAPEAPESRQRSEKDNLFGRHKLEGAIHLIFWGHDPNSG